MVRDARGSDLATLAASLGGIGTVAAVLRLVSDVSLTTVALALLLVVLATATVGRLRVAIIASIVAMLVFNFFFLPPVRTFTIADPQNWIALVAFLIVAVIASNLSAAAQDRTREAIDRRNEVTRLFDLTRDVLLTTDTTDAVPALATHIARRFELPRVAVCLPSDAGWRIYQGGTDAIALEPSALDAALAQARGTSDNQARRRARSHAPAAGNRELRMIALRHGTDAIGVLVADWPDVDLGALDAVAGVAAIAIERAQFLAERDTAELARQKADLAATLLASVSHDLRTPLTAVKVAVENLREAQPPDQRRAQAAVATAELDRLTQLVQDILDMARVDAGAIQIDRQWVTAADIVDAAAAHARHALASHRLDVDADAETELHIDPRLVSVALAHLLENAARYSPPACCITVRARADHDGLHVSVVDQGAGIDPGELDHLFERFYRGRSARETTHGTGMGLSITRGLLAATGGRVWGENVPGAGARFSMSVPAVPRPAATTA